MPNIPYILSLGYKQQITEVCRYLGGLDFEYFVMYIIFNNGSKFVLTNMSHLSIAYYTDEFYKEDFSCDSDLILHKSYYLCDQTASVSERFRIALEERFGIHRVYYIIRSCAECKFIFGAIKNKKISDYFSIYKQTVRAFEEFCVSFVDHFSDLIRTYVPAYKYSFILTNPALRRRVITDAEISAQPLSNREQECLWFASTGKSIKEVAKILGISPATVETHNKKIREKLRCATMVEAVVQGIQTGIIGKINYCTPKNNVSKIDGFQIVKNMDVLATEISKTNLALLNAM